MSIKPSDSEKSDTLGHAYETLLDKALEQAQKTDSNIHQALDGLEEDIVDFTQLSADEAVHLERSIKRDLADAAHHLVESGSELKDWLGFDLTLIKSELWRKFAEAADKSTLEYLKLKQIAANAEYRTGEIIGLGTLICDHCNAVLHFHKPGHIPPCGKCHGTRFHRSNDEI